MQTYELLCALLDVVEHSFNGREFHYFDHNDLRPAQDCGERFFRGKVGLFNPGLLQAILPLGDGSRAAEQVDSTTGQYNASVYIPDSYEMRRQTSVRNRTARQVARPGW